MQGGGAIVAATLMLVASAASASDAAAPSTEPAAPTGTSSERPPSARYEVLTTAEPAPEFEGETEHRSVPMMVTGIVLSAVAGTVLVTGIIVEAVSAPFVGTGSEEGGDIAVGLVLGGLGGVAVGAPLAAIGAQDVSAGEASRHQPASPPRGMTVAVHGSF